MWLCPTTPLTSVLGEGNMTRPAHLARCPTKDRPGLTPCKLALCLVEQLLSHSCPTASGLRLSHKRECQGQPDRGSGW